MSNVVETVCDAEHLYIKGADGREWTMLRAELVALAETTAGTVAERQSQLLDLIQASVDAAIGDQAPFVFVDFNLLARADEPLLMSLPDERLTAMPQRRP